MSEIVDQEGLDALRAEEVRLGAGAVLDRAVEELHELAGVHTASAGEALTRGLAQP